MSSTCGSPHPTLDLVCTKPTDARPCRNHHQAPYAPAQDGLEVWLNDDGPPLGAARRKRGAGVASLNGVTLQEPVGPPTPSDPYGKHVRDSDPDNAHEAWGLVEPDVETLKARVLEHLRSRPGEVVPTKHLDSEGCGLGFSASRRARDLREEGWPLENVRIEGNTWGWRYAAPDGGEVQRGVDVDWD